MKRLQQSLLIRDLPRKMVFLTGPRQVGKTWLARAIADSYERSLTLNFDDLSDRRIIVDQSWLPSTELLILDELHKMAGWKNYLKGLYDTRPKTQHILVTGSARIDTCRQTGDSLAGRFFRHRLLPITLAELASPSANDLERLLSRGGFPEPYLVADPVDAQRWRLQYVDGLIRHEVLNFKRLHDFRALDLTFRLLRQRVGSPVSYASIARDVAVSLNTIKRYVEILEALYIIFRVTPWSRNIARSLLKEPKFFLMDSALVDGDEEARFENHVAVSLLKYVYALEDYRGIESSLHYIRTRDGKDVDFCVVENHIPVQLLEVTWADAKVSSSLRRIQKQTQIPATQLVCHLKREQMVEGIQVRSAPGLLASLRGWEGSAW